MVLFENNLIKLNYDPASDVLEVAYPDLDDYLLVEVKHSMDMLVDHIVSYDIKRLLLDSSHTIVRVDVEKSRETTTYLVSGLAKTRLEKLARLQSNNATVEATAQSNIAHVKEAVSLPFDLQSFPDKAEALKWLKGELVLIPRT